MAWEIIAFESSRGEKPVEKFIKSLDQPTIAKAAHELNLLEQNGPYLAMPHTKKLEGGFYELRIRGKQEVRIIYAFMKNKIYLLHAFKKKTQKTPRKEMKIAIKQFELLTSV